MNAERILHAKITSHSIGTAINALGRAHDDARGLGDNDAVRELRAELVQIMLQLEHMESVLDAVIQEASE